MKGESVVTAVKKKLSLDTDSELADALGISISRVQRFKAGDITPLQIANLVTDAKDAGQRYLKNSHIPYCGVLSNYEIQEVEAKQIGKFSLRKTNRKNRLNIM